jgi:hypothetical protein
VGLTLVLSELLVHASVVGNHLLLQAVDHQLGLSLALIDHRGESCLELSYLAFPGGRAASGLLQLDNDNVLGVLVNSFLLEEELVLADHLALLLKL